MGAIQSSINSALGTAAIAGGISKHIKVQEKQAKLAEDYLVKMRTTYSQIEPYIDVIRLCRKYE